MKFGAFGLGGAFDQVMETAHMIESAGYDGMFFGHHHSPDLREAVGLKATPVMGTSGRGHQWPLIAALASHTKTLEFGTAVFLLSMAHPIHVAEEVATIDHISKGRVILGVGPGYNKADFDIFGIPVPNRVSLFEEGLEIVRRAWTEDRFNFVGKRYSVRNARILPKPFQKPHPPIWVGPWSLEGFKRAARQGDGAVTDPMQGRAALKEFVPVYREVCEARGKKPVVALMRETMIASNKEEALNQFGESIVETMRYYSWSGVLSKEHEPWLKNVKSADQINFQMVNSDNRLLWGSPSEVVDQIHELDEELGGIDYLLPTFPRGRGAQGQKQQIKAAQLFAEKVIPRFR